jgi:hypothetical protein
MGFWSALGKGLLGAAGAVAAPFTGGASLAAVIPAIAGTAGSVIGAMGDQAGQNRSERDIAERAFSTDFERAAMGRADIDLARRGESREAEIDAYKKALRSALALNMGDVSIDRSQFKSQVPNIQFGGGMRPSAIGPQGRQAAELLNATSLRRLMSPDPFEKLPALEKQAPEKASFWEKLAGPVGLTLSAYEQAAKRMPQTTPAAPQAPIASPGIGKNVTFGPRNPFE